MGTSYKTELFKTSGAEGPSGQRRLVVDEEAFFNYHEKKKLQGDEMMDEKEKLSKTYDKFGEPNLAKKLGLENETDETIVKKDDGKKKTKEELEKDVDEGDAERD